MEKGSRKLGWKSTHCTLFWPDGESVEGRVAHLHTRLQCQPHTHLNTHLHTPNRAVQIFHELPDTHHPTEVLIHKHARRGKQLSIISAIVKVIGEKELLLHVDIELMPRHAANVAALERRRLQTACQLVVIEHVHVQRWRKR